MTYRFSSEAANSARRVALVTGANGAIGKAIARGLASAPGHTVVLVCRSEQKAQDATADIRRSTGSSDVWYETADLSQKASIFDLAERWPGALDILVNNAAVTPRRREETPQGIELQFATNVLGYFWMTQAFGDLLQASSSARVVDVASYWAGGLDLDDLEFKRRRYDNGQAYRQSKQANRMLAAGYGARFDPTKVTVNACHPGDVNSQLSNNLGFGGSESPDQGARTPVWLALDPTLAGQTGGYYENQRAQRCRFAADMTAVNALFERCLTY
jgi:retinol dehydrogenase 12